MKNYFEDIKMSELYFLDEYLQEVEILARPGMEETIHDELDELRTLLFKELSKVLIDLTNDFFEKHGSKRKILEVHAEDFFKGPIFSTGDN